MLAPNGKEYWSVQIGHKEDIFGREVKVGDVLAYSVRQGSYHAIHFGRVYKTEEIVHERNINYERSQYISYWRIGIIVKSKVFVYKKAFDNIIPWKKNVISAKQFVLVQLQNGTIPENWKSCYVNFPKKTTVGLSRAIIIDPALLPETYYKVIMDNETVISNLTLDE